jgi:hypothetical protein
LERKRGGGHRNTTNSTGPQFTPGTIGQCIYNYGLYMLAIANKRLSPSIVLGFWEGGERNKNTEEP